MTYLKHLSELRRKLSSSQMSLLVGSGFSKNVSPKFPTWDELLFDLTCELYAEEIQTGFEQHLRNSNKRNRLRYSAFIRQNAHNILLKEGYLEIVSKYISRKGYTESIATYIEERTPYIHKEGNKVYLTLKGVCEEISQDRLALHRAIIRLPWNNIYTTNYDELLDCCIDSQIIEELQHNIGLLNDEIETFNARETELLSELVKINDTPSISEESQIEDFAPIGKTQPEENKLKINTSQQLYDLNIELSNVRRQKDDKEQQIRNLSISISNSYRVITYAAGLKLRRNRNIVKLHGSLRTTTELSGNEFEFDGDFKSQYVISAEDYRSYPEKHEAFTQLMRISLLQESFCLVGFSGVDPNFLAWIGWVRDILQRQAAKKSDESDYKIYLIDINTEEDSADKILFFENHSIIRIPIRSPSVLAIINSENVFPNDVSPSDAIRLFLNFLAADHELIPYVPLKDLSSEQDRKMIWRKLDFIESHKMPDFALIEQTTNTLDKLKNNIFLPDINHSYTFNQLKIIQSSEKQLNLHHDDPVKCELICRLVLHAIKDYFVPIDDVLEPKVIDAMLRFSSTQADTKNLIERTKSLKGQISQVQQYEDILRLAYNMYFKELEEKLKAWQPDGRSILQKAGFLSIFDPLAAQLLIEDQLNNYDSLNGEERLYAFEMLSYFKLSLSWQRDKKLDKTIGQFEHTGFRTLYDNFRYLQEELAPKKAKILPYGKGRFLIENTVHFISHTDNEMAQQYLMMLAESGVQMAVGHVTFQTAQDWYPVFKIGFEQYPFPFLFYAIQYGSDDFLARVGQDYAFSEKLKKQLPALVQNLFRCQKFGPPHLKQNTYHVLAELLNAVEPKVWEKSFIESWMLAVKENRVFADRLNPEKQFFINGIKYMTSIKALVIVVRDCLASVSGTEASIGIDFLYHLNFNQHFKLIYDKKSFALELGSEIKRLIANLQGKVDTNLFALGNIYPLLNAEQIDEIKSILKHEDFTKIKNVRIWHIILFFIYNDEATVNSVKKAILQHHALWITGINGNSVSGGIESIDVSLITKGPENSKGLSWSQKEVGILYKKITDALPAIETVLGRGLGFLSYSDILEDMLVFLNSHKAELFQRTDYDSTVLLAKILFHKQREFESIRQGLLDDERSPVLRALSEISKQIRVGHLDKTAFTTILNKAMLQHQPGLEAALAYLAIWVDDKKNGEQMKAYHSFLKELLDRFSTNMPADSDIPFIHEKLISIAYYLQTSGVNDPPVKDWISKGAQSNFNNVKQRVLKQLKSSEV